MRGFELLDGRGAVAVGADAAHGDLLGLQRGRRLDDAGVRGPQLVLVEGREPEHPRVVGVGKAGARHDAQPLLERVSVVRGARVVRHELAEVRRHVGRHRGETWHVGVLDALVALGREPSQRGRLGQRGPTHSELLRLARAAHQLLVGVGAVGARLQGRCLGTHPLELRQHLGVLATVGVALGGGDASVELRELGGRGLEEALCVEAAAAPPPARAACGEPRRARAGRRRVRSSPTRDRGRRR